MYYIIFATDKIDTLNKRLAARPAHLARLQVLQDKGDLLTAGPFPVSHEQAGMDAFTGSCVIAKFTSLEAAELWANEDPYFLAGVYANILVKPFKKVF